MAFKDLLKDNIRKYIYFTDSEFELFSQFFKEKTISKKQFLLRQGNVCQFEGFVIKGLFRVFVIDEDGKEHVLYFAAEDWWVTDIDSFINQKPTNVFIEALEDSKILYINYEDKEYLYKNLPKVEELFRKMTQKTCVALQRRMVGNLSKTATVRYVEFLNQYPQITSRLTNLQIAAYLGVSHEFLSKIRSKLAKKK